MNFSAMTVSSSSANNENKKKLNKIKSTKATTTDNKKEITRTTHSDDLVKTPTHRSNSPGVRLVGCRIYDSHNGKTCHQCRQKTMDFVASCNNSTEKKQCSIHFCHRCLLNRYGEKAEEVALIHDWICPKCRGICNCSFCMKKRGHRPTGNLVHTAKANGLSSVSEMLNIKESDNLDSKKASSKKRKASNKESAVSLVKKHREGDGFQTPMNSEVQAESSKMSCVGRETRNSKLKRLRENNGNENVTAENKDDKSLTLDTSPRKRRISEQTLRGKEKMYRRDYGGRLIGKESDIKIPKKDSQVYSSNHSETEVPSNVNIDDTVGKHKPLAGSHDCDKNNITEVKSTDVEIPLPCGIILNSVAAIDMPAEDVGHAFQFLEFCEAFGQILNLRKGQSELFLRELVCGRSKRRLHSSPIVQFHIQLLSVIQKDSGKKNHYDRSLDENSWLQAIIKYVSESHFSLEELHVGCFKMGDYGYDQLDCSKKLKLLNFLCDEVLGTADFRGWIDEQNSKLAVRDKKVKEKALADKEKKNMERKKLQNEIAKAVVMKNGVPLSISEHAALVAKIKLEVAQTLGDTMEESEVVEPRLDAVRSEPICLDGRGRRFWRLKCYSGEMDILLQDFEEGNLVTVKERWHTFDIVQKAAVEKYISSLRKLAK
ncbi:hypothetical protein Ddye_002169 [Dipteronia dyeriana]|uniref:DDT domain-containing protein n=1 Tax=Dipteronia dyeriana TaxID=168575 RepID=A0AAE0CU37_9ROSI|nr:hypothetical protein Ddye_002169 [Dipteronia dyeriana]